MHKKSIPFVYIFAIICRLFQDRVFPIKLRIGMLYYMSNIYRHNVLKTSVPDSLSLKFSNLFRRYRCFKFMHSLTRHTIMKQWLYCGHIVNVEGKIATVSNETQVFHDQPESIDFWKYSIFRGTFGTLRNIQDQALWGNI